VHRDVSRIDILVRVPLQRGTGAFVLTTMPRDANLLLCVGAATLLGVVPWADAWNADDACCAKGTIKQVPAVEVFGRNLFHMPTLEIELGCSSSTSVNKDERKVSTSRAGVEAKMDFSLAPGKYDIGIVTTGCPGAPAGKPNASTIVQSGSCTGVEIKQDGSSGGNCVIFLIDRETFDDSGDSKYDMPPTIASIKSENVAIKRFPGTNRSDGGSKNSQHATVTLQVLDTGGFNPSVTTGHRVIFDAGTNANDNEHLADWAAIDDYDPTTNKPQFLLGGGNAYTAPACTQSFDGQLAANYDDDAGPYKCELELWPTELADGKNVFFSVRVEELRNNVVVGRTSVVYGSVSVSNVQRDKFLIQATSKPKICDKFENVGTCSPDLPASTGPKITNEGGPTELLAAATNAGGGTANGTFEKMNPLRLPLIYNGVPTVPNTGGRKDGAKTIPSWLESYVMMEAYIWDEDLGFGQSLDKVSMQITVTDKTEWAGSEKSQIEIDRRGDQILPGCGKVIAFSDGAEEVVKENFYTKTVNYSQLAVGLSGGTHGKLQPGGTGTNRQKHTVRRVRWFWQPFGHPDLLAASYKKADGSPGLVVDTSDPHDFEHAFGQSRCEFNFKATDNSAAYVTGANYGTALPNQESNIVRRTYLVGTEKDSLTSDLSEPLPMIYGSYFYDLTPKAATGASPSVVPATIAFGKDTRCLQADENDTVTGAILQASQYDPNANRSAMTPSQRLYHDYCKNVEGGYEVFVELLTKTGDAYAYTDGVNMATMMIMGNDKLFDDSVSVVCETFDSGTASHGTNSKWDDNWPTTSQQLRTAPMNGCRIKFKKPGVTDMAASTHVLKLRITVKTTQQGDEFLLRMTTRNLKDNNFGERPEFQEVWDFTTVDTTAANTQNFLFGTGNRRSRSRRGLNGREVATTSVLALGDTSVKRARKRRQTVTTSGGVSWDSKGGAEFKFKPPSFYNGVAGKAKKVSTASLGTIERKELMRDTVEVCNAMLMNATSTNQTNIDNTIREQTDKLAVLYDGLFNDFELKAQAEQTALHDLAKAVLKNSKTDNGDSGQDEKVTEDFREAVQKSLDKTEIEFKKQVEADVKFAKTMNASNFEETELLYVLAQRLDDANAYMNLMMVQILATKQQEDKHHALLSANTTELHSAVLDPAPVEPGKWSSSAAGWTQIWILTLVTLGFLIQLAAAVKAGMKPGSIGWFQDKGTGHYTGLNH